MIYLIEGSDLVGKSTFITNLAKELKSPKIVKPSRPQSLVNPEYWDIVERNEMLFYEAISQSEYNLILDRIVWFSDPAYAPVFRNKKPDWELLARGFAINPKVIVAYLQCNYDVKVKRGREEEKYELTEDIDRKITDGYNGVIKKFISFGGYMCRVNTTYSSLECYKPAKDFLRFAKNVWGVCNE